MSRDDDMAHAVEVLLRCIGEDPKREGLLKTPRRFSKALLELTKGFHQRPEDIIGDALFDNANHRDVVVVRDIPIYSLCEHHILPFFGKVHIAYLPNERVVGLSKLPRLVKAFAQRLQIQERLTTQIATCIHELLKPKGVGVIMECTHLCMEMRGTECLNARTVTRSVLGAFSQHETIRRDFESAVAYACCLAPKNSSSTTSFTTQHYEQTIPTSSLADERSARTKSPPLPPLKGLPSSNFSSRPDSVASDLKLYLRCAAPEYSKMVSVVKEATRFGINQTTGCSMLDIGAGNGHMLCALYEAGVRISRYTAFEPNRELRKELQTVLEEEVKIASNNTRVFPDAFSETIGVSDGGGVADIVLMSHCLYGIGDKYSFVKNALKFVAPGGVLLLFHRYSAGGTISKISGSLLNDGILHYTTSYDVSLDLPSGLIEPDIFRIAAYTKTDLHSYQVAHGMQTKHTLGYIAVEPGTCRLGSDKTMTSLIDSTRKRVSYAARSKEPAAVIQPTTVVGIQSCVQAVSRRFSSGKLSIVGGGHSSNCLEDDALAVDMIRWKSVSVDVERQIVIAGGGTTIGAITEAAERYGLAVPLGDRPGVGLGLILQGGINHLMRSRGLAADNIVRVEYVSPTGELCVAQTDEELWPFRGAGSNFGIVVQVSMRAYSVPTIITAHCEYDMCDASSDAEIMVSYGCTAEALPFNVALDGYLFWASLESVHFCTALFDSCGSDFPVISHKVNASLESLAGAPLKRTTPLSLAPSALFDRELYMSSSCDPKNVLGGDPKELRRIRSIKRCILFGNLTQDLAKVISEALREAPTKLCYFHILHGGGKVAEVPPTFTAFGCRDWSFAAVVTGRFQESTLSENETACWLERTTQKLLPMAKGVYGADLGPSDTRLSKFAFGMNSLHLAHLKRVRDPLDILGCGCPLAGYDEGGVADDPRVRGRGVVVVFCGRRHAGKDWLASAVAATLRPLLPADGVSISLSCISDVMKHRFADETPGVTAEQLISDRSTKEKWRERLTDFYEKEKEKNPSYDRACFVDVVTKSKADILLLTGLRDGAAYARALAGRAVVLVHVVSPDACKRSRGWQGPTPIDQSDGERSAETMDSSIWDVDYCNDGSSNPESASMWAKSRLIPAILRRCLRYIPDAPSPGIIYKDLAGGLLLQPFGLSLCVAMMVEKLQGSCAESHIDAILAPETMGVLFAGPLASVLQKPVIIARKPCRLLGDVDSAHYAGSNIANLASMPGAFGSDGASLQIVAGSIIPGQSILIVDDCLASGATLECLVQLARVQGGCVRFFVCVMDLPDMGSGEVARKLGITVLSLLQFQGK